MDTVNETKKKRKIKPWNELTITDDLLWSSIFVTLVAKKIS